MTSVSPDARRVMAAARGPVVVALLILSIALGTALLDRAQEGGGLDPRSPRPEGSRALARLLAQRGVDVTVVHTMAEAARAVSAGTLLVTVPGLLEPAALTKLAGKADETVLVAPPDAVVAAVDDRLAITGLAEVDAVEPGCDLGPAAAAGAADLGGDLYGPAEPAAPPRDARFCYPGEGGHAMVRVPTGEGGVTILGTGAPFTNEALGTEGNAALALRLLGRHPKLVWYLPSLDDPGLARGDRSLLELMPPAARFALVQLAIAAGVLALWRVRRLGPVVAEDLPVVVRAAETTEGRARLYRSAHAADHAAEVLREACRTRLAQRLGLPADAEPGALTEAAARRSGRAPSAVHALLHGAGTLDEAALVRLADDLDTLENEVRTA